MSMPPINARETPTAYWNRLTPGEKEVVREYHKNSVIPSMTEWLLARGCMSSSFEQKAMGPAERPHNFNYGRKYRRVRAG